MPVTIVKGESLIPSESQVARHVLRLAMKCSNVHTSVPVTKVNQITCKQHERSRGHCLEGGLSTINCLSWNIPVTEYLFDHGPTT